jgi:hypothetical protein
LEALRLALRDDPALDREPAVEAALRLPAAEIADQARLAGCTLERLLRWCKCARRSCAELILLSTLPASAKPAAARTLERGFDAIELALVAVWEHEHGMLSEALSDRQILQAIHYPVLLVDAEGRLHWLNGAAHTLWRTTTLVGSPEQQPRNLADVLPDLAKPWQCICDAAGRRASRCRFEQPLDTLAGRRWFEVVAWPVAPVAVGTACVALFLRDITRERAAWSAGEHGLLSRASG